LIFFKKNSTSLTGIFLPDDETEKLRTYCRLRAAWLSQGASVIQ